MITLSINGESRALDVEPSTPLLWVIRDYAGLTGTKFGCGIGQCGACTVHIDGEAVRSCTMPVEALENVEITTIEGFHPAGDHPVQRAWQEEDVALCPSGLRAELGRAVHYDH